MITITGTIRILPDKLPAALPVMASMVASSRAEPGCLGYAYALDIMDPALIHVIEHWHDRAALAAHFASPHLQAWRGQFTALGIHDRRLQMVEGIAEAT